VLEMGEKIAKYSAAVAMRYGEDRFAIFSRRFGALGICSRLQLPFLGLYRKGGLEPALSFMCKGYGKIDQNDKTRENAQLPERV